MGQLTQLIGTLRADSSSNRNTKDRQASSIPSPGGGGRRRGSQQPKPPGSRSKWSQATLIERVWYMGVVMPVRTFICIANITVFFLAYLGAMLPVLWAKVLWPRFYYFYEGLLYMSLQAFIGYWGYTADYDVYEFGDDITQYGDTERVLVMCNHQSTADVPTLFSVLQSKGVATRKTIWLMDVMFRWTPFGIIGRMHGDYFIQQGKATRDRELERLKKHLKKVFWNRDRRWIILFPEGGFFYNRVESSQRYGREHGFPHLEHCTLPRYYAVQAILEEVGPRDEEDMPLTNHRMGLLTAGIKLIKDAMGNIRAKNYVKETRPPIKYILDATIAYPNAQPLSILTLMFGTRERCDIAIHYKIIPAEEVPFDDEEALRDWMYELYARKDRLLDNYYKTGAFVEGEEGERIVFSWWHILGQYIIWLTVFMLEIQLYWWVGAQLGHLLQWLFYPG